MTTSHHLVPKPINLPLRFLPINNIQQLAAASVTINHAQSFLSMNFHNQSFRQTCSHHLHTSYLQHPKHPSVPPRPSCGALAMPPTQPAAKPSLTGSSSGALNVTKTRLIITRTDQPSSQKSSSGTTAPIYGKSNAHGTVFLSPR